MFCFSSESLIVSRSSLRCWTLSASSSRSYLFLFDIFDSKIEPNAKSSVAGVWPNEQIVLQV
ncbi:hypothetical protein BpHYR1_044466 [Brachionus plicatilis]|uniref:Uncharacterized protein n=1 Tax=Brachionus plicatilis TaxID=10195 RepID=A0A3M7P4D4_BRAPC|nr:hypothetical protein BpHYR1_044466 [Brachionus plicatilis]